MGQKINPIGYRLAFRRDWNSVWFARGAQFREQVLADSRARDFIRKRFDQAMISKIVIKRHSSRVHVHIHTARPGMVIGKKGEDIEKLKVDLRKIFNEGEIRLDIEEIRQPEVNAQLIAMNITSQLEKRVAFRRAMRRAVASAMRLNVLGVKVICSGRLNGAEIARTERYNEGRVPLHTLRAEIDYGFSEAHTSMGVVGVKVWIFNGEKFQRTRKAPVAQVEEAPPEEDAGEAADAAAEEAAGAEAEAAEPAEAAAAEEAEDAAEEAAGEAEEEAEEESEPEEAPAKKKPAAKKAAAKKPAAKKAAAKKKPAKAAAGDADAPEGKAPAAKKKPAAKKPAAKKPAAKKPAAKKAAAKRKAPAKADEEG